MARNMILLASGLGISVTVAFFLVPHASQNPDGLDRVAQDLKFADKASPPAQNLPFAQYFQEYRWQDLPDPTGTTVGAMVGMGICCGLAWGVGTILQGRSRE